MPIEVPYDPVAGTMYARAYALYASVPENLRLFFYGPEDDCTNFISQCVWAAYGGWLPGFTPQHMKENAARILQDVRQVKGVWYGSKSFIGSYNWCRVVDFYNYVTNKGKNLGPMAALVDEGEWWKVDPRVIRQGDVIQLVVASYVPDRYGHGLYVTRAGSSWEEVLICCHTYDRLDEPLIAYSQYPKEYRKLRILRFSPASFES